MTILRRLAAVLLLLLLAVRTAAAAERPPVVLVSIDGFRADYLDRGVTPTLSALATSGARAAMRPSFPSKTFPNHYTLVTGLRPDRHGVVDNTMEDPAMPGVTFRMSNKAAVTDRRWWDQGEPIWVTAERAGVRTGTMFWPGSEAAIRGVRPSHWLPFDQSLPSDARVDQVLAWMDLPPGQRPRLVTLYFDVVDTAGHEFGPDSPEVNAAAAEVDRALARLTAGLRQRAVSANLVIVADHGMAALSEERRVYLDDLTPRDSFRSLSGGAFVTLHPAEGQGRAVERRILGRHPHFSCWRKSQIPRRFKYGRNPRVAPIFCLADVGWTLTTRDFRAAKPERGSHGFDPFSADMAAVFVASGPDIRQGVRLRTFDNVDVYPLLARLLGVAGAPNEGKLRSTRAALVDR